MDFSSAISRRWPVAARAADRRSAGLDRFKLELGRADGCSASYAQARPVMML
jgi:hypothetical protein